MKMWKSVCAGLLVVALLPMSSLAAETLDLKGIGRMTVPKNVTFEKSAQAGRPLTDTPEHMINAQLRWQATDRLSTWLRGEYRGKSQRFDGNPSSLTGNNQREYQALGDLKGYALFHLGGSYRVTRNATISLNVFNLLDKNFNKYRSWVNTAGETQMGSLYYRTTSGTKGTASDGQTFWISANIDF